MPLSLRYFVGPLYGHFIREFTSPFLVAQSVVVVVLPCFTEAFISMANFFFSQEFEPRGGFFQFMGSFKL